MSSKTANEILQNIKTIPEQIQVLEKHLLQTKGTEKGELLVKLADKYIHKGDYLKAEELAKDLLQLGETHQNVRLKIRAYAVLVTIYMIQHKVETAKEHLTKIEVLNKKLSDKWVQLKLYTFKADIARLQNNQEALQIYAEALLHLATELEDTYFSIQAHERLSGLYALKAEYNQVLYHLLASLQLTEKIKNKRVEHHRSMVHYLVQLAQEYSRQSEMGVFDKRKLEEARDCLEKARQIAHTIQYQLAFLHIPLTLGDIEIKVKNYGTAFEAYQSALKMAKSLNNQYLIHYCNSQMAEIYIIKKKFKKAMVCYQNSFKTALKLGDKISLSIYSLNLAECLYEQKQYVAALEYAQQAHTYAEESKSLDNCLIIYKLLAILHKELGNIDEVYDYMQRHIDIKDQLYTAEKEKSMVEMQTKYETEKKEQEAQQLRQLEQIKSRFFSQITHEFRTPLTLILGPLQQIVNKPKAPNKKALDAQLSLVIRNGERLSSLVNQLLDLSKLESGKMDVKKSHGEIIAFVQVIINAFQTLAQQQHISLQFHTTTSQLFVHFDTDKLEKILYNLLSNAFKFTPTHGNISLQLTTQNSTAKQTTLQIEVRDTGTGISAEKLPHIFDRFYQADNSATRQVEGTGIGLSLVKELLELQGGTIEAESQLGKGTTFRLELPLELATANQTATSQLGKTLKRQYAPVPSTATPSNVAKAKRKNQNTILVVEDNPDMQTYIHQILSPHYKVLQAINGAIGVEKALEEVPDLIVSDVMMPEKDGYTLCKELKTDEKTNHIPIILLTAKAALSSRLEGLQQGADTYLSKPFSPEELLLHIRNHIQVRRELQKKYSQALQSTDPKANNETLSDPFLQKLIETIETIETHLNDIELSVTQLSQYMFLSRQQIHRKLRALTNYSTSEFIRLLRLKKAKALLESQQYTITEIAYEVGFSTPSYFSRSFAKQYGVSPSKWSVARD